MKKILSFLFMLVMLFAAVPIFAYAAGDELKYEFTTADELNDWVADGGTWAIKDGLLIQSGGTPGAWNMQLGLKDKKFKDFTVKMKLKVDKESLGMGWAGIHFRKVNLEDTQEMSGYGLTLQGKNGSGKTVFIDWPHGSKTWEEEAAKNIAGEWNEIVMVVSGNTLSLYMNENIKSKKPSIFITDKDNGWLDEGYISLAAGNAKISYDYMFIYTGDKQSLAFTTENPVTSKNDTTVKAQSTQQQTSKTSSISSKTNSNVSDTISALGETSSQSVSSEQNSTTNTTIELSSDTSAVISDVITNVGKGNAIIPIIIIIVGVLGLCLGILLFIKGKKKA